MLKKAEGIVIRTVPYGEADVVLTLYTREAGKVAVMAKGAKKPKNRLAGAAQPFVYGIFLYYSSSGMSSLNQADIIKSYRHIREDLWKASYIAYAAELLDKLTNDRETNPFLFELFWQILEHVEEGDDAETLIRIFELKMTDAAGIKPQLDQCINCGNKEGTFSFSIRGAGFLCHRCSHRDEYRMDISPKAIQLLRTFYYLDLKRLGSITLKPETKKELRQVMDTYYEEYSGLYLRSKRFMEQMEKWNPVEDT